MKKPTLLLRWLSITLLLGAVALAIAWFAGVFKEKIPGDTRVKLKIHFSSNATLEVATTPVEQYETALGSVRAVQEASLSARILAKVEEVRVKAGQGVTKGEVLVVLDDTDLKARLEQARQAAASAASADSVAQRELERNRSLLEKKILSPNEWDRVQDRARRAAADLTRAREAEKEAVANLGFATLRAPIDGIVVDKQVNTGDMAAPGRELLSLYDPKRMQLWARVRETLAARLRPGHKVKVQIDALPKVCEGVVDEVVPASDVGSRTFLVKVSGPCPPGIYTGMSGRLLLPMGNREEIHIPAAAIGRVGQLALVKVVGEDKGVRRRYIRLGGNVNPTTVRVVAGLKPGERILREFDSPAGGE